MDAMNAFGWTRHFSTDLSMAVGSATPAQAAEITSPIFDGFQVIVMMEGRLSSRIDGSASFDIAEPGVLVVQSTGHHEGRDRLAGGVLQRFVRIGFDAASAERNGIVLERLAASRAPRLYRGDVDVIRLPLSPALKTIAMQALVCPVQGAMRDLYLAGKGMELAALTLDALLQDDSSEATPLGRVDLERLWHARELALEHYRQPLTLHELARRVGTNVNKLNAGFRQAFGATVFEFIQQHRLQEAHRMLATGAYSVSEVALSVGYGMAHFSTLFRQRYGCSPSQLVR